MISVSRDHSRPMRGQEECRERFATPKIYKSDLKNAREEKYILIFQWKIFMYPVIRKFSVSTTTTTTSRQNDIVMRSTSSDSVSIFSIISKIRRFFHFVTFKHMPFLRIWAFFCLIKLAKISLKIGMEFTNSTTISNSTSNHICGHMACGK